MPEPLSIYLYPIALEHLDAEDVSGAALAELLNLPAPPEWPPEHNDAATRQWMRTTYLADAWQPHWAGRYVVADGALVGIAGYFGPPSDDGTVEIGYAIIPSAQRRGYASEAVRQLVAHAFDDASVVRVRATTLAEGAASQGVLTKCGFVKTGEAVDPGEGPVWQFAFTRQG